MADNIKSGSCFQIGEIDIRIERFEELDIHMELLGEHFRPRFVAQLIQFTLFRKIRWNITQLVAHVLRIDRIGAKDIATLLFEQAFEQFVVKRETFAQPVGLAIGADGTIGIAAAIPIDHAGRMGATVEHDLYRDHLHITVADIGLADTVR